MSEPLTSFEYLVQRRCTNKRAYWQAKAIQVAKQDSARTGELIVAYECYDCGMWHVGHAQPEDIKARDGYTGTFCEACGEIIQESRMKKLKRFGITKLTCGPKCPGLTESAIPTSDSAPEEPTTYPSAQKS